MASTNALWSASGPQRSAPKKNAALAEAREMVLTFDPELPADVPEVM